MLVNRVKLKRSTPVSNEFNIVHDEAGNFISCSLPEPEHTAKVYRVRDGELIPFRIDQVQVRQEYERDPFTPDQTALYKRVLYSDLGRQLLNKLKNSRLITVEQTKSFFAQAAPKLLSNKLVKGLLDALSQEPKFRKFKRVNFDPVEEYCFNTIPLKDLGITKEDVFAVFQQAGLING